MMQLACLSEYPLVELDDCWKFFIFLVVIHECDSITFILVGLADWDHKLLNSV